MLLYHFLKTTAAHWDDMVFYDNGKCYNGDKSIWTFK